MAQLERRYVFQFQLENDAITNRNYQTTDTIRKTEGVGTGTTPHSFLFLSSKIRRRHATDTSHTDRRMWRFARDWTVFPIPTKKWHRVYSLWAAFLLLLVYYKRTKICPAIYLPKCINIFKETLVPCTTKCPQCCLCVFLSGKTLSDIKNHHISETTDKLATLPPFLLWRMKLNNSST